jgi:urease accessory protein
MLRWKHRRFFVGVALLCALCAAGGPQAWAHEGTADLSGFSAGFMHPLLGWDHLLAMVAVGLWGSLLGGQAIWLLPVAFPLMMAAGGALGVAGVAIPGVEVGIASSAIVLGAAVASVVRPAFWIAMILVGAFAILHGHAHGTELPLAASPLTYSGGFVVATGLLHLVGIGMGTFSDSPSGLIGVRLAGLAIAVAGIAFLAGAL